TYGYRRITKLLKIKYGIIMNHKKVNRIMKKYDIRAKYTKRRSYKHFRNEGNVVSNIVDRNFNESNIWFTDIIYLIIKGKRRYLSTILDSATRKVVAYKISKFNDNKLVMDTLNKAIKKTKNSNNILIHSDQG
ncbi:MAG: DDE-type integrase/transposase/recombinase, partial [Mycoplasmatales bacterium]